MVKVSTSKTIVELFHFIKRVEVFTGRTESVRWGPREIDIDLILYNEEVFENDYLIVPHKGIAERDFVLVPLDEIAPGIIIPGLKKSPAELLKKVTEKNIIRIFPEKIN